MASSQVHISPFGCVLGSHSPCDRYNPKNFHKNLKVLVNSCISDEMSLDSHENGGRIDLSDLWVHKPLYLQKNSHPDGGEEKPTMDKDSNNWDRVRKMVLSVDEEDKRDVSPSRSSAAEVPHPGGVSSLVRRWKDIEKPAANNNPSVCISRSNSTSSTTCDDSSSIDNGGEPENARDKDSDALERERLRVTDIIKKLICNLGGEGGSHSNREAQGNAGGDEPSACPMVKPPAEHLRCHPKVLNSPRIIRGRQAFAELLTQMELERKKEIQGLVRLNAVSKFQHKGRIQAMLRLKFLRGRVSNYEAPESNRLTQPSIMHRRERFNGRAPLGMDDSKGIPKEIHHHHHENTCEAGKVFKSTSLEVDQSSLQPEEAGGTQSSLDKGFSTSIQHSQTSVAGGIQLEMCPDNSQETILATHDEVRVPSEVGHHNESIKPPEIVDEEFTCHQQMESELGKECAPSQSGWDEMGYGVSEEPVVNQDWITDVSRPRSEWEDLRQARYQEMLDPFIDNLDIQQLLQRRSVSSFLSGDLREKIDRLMISRSQGNQRTFHSDVHEVKEKAEADKGDKVEEAGHECQEDEKDNDNHDEEEKCCEFDCQIEELNGHADSVDRSWSYNQGPNSSDGSDEMTSAYSPPPQFSHFYSQNNQPYWSSKSHPSIEIQLIYDLKNQMEQLHQEIFEIQRSIRSCMNTQKKLQRSIRHEVSAALTQPGQKRGRGLGGNKRTRKRNCCICGDSKIDSLLYRCGHMCTCFSCAHQLKSGDQNCPICRAPILDIVRTQTN